MANKALRLYNTAARKKQIFKAMNDKEVRMYSCGPTVYDSTHIGHMFAYVFVDILKRVLKADGYKVKSVMNITDVGHLTSDSDTGEDKIEKSAREKGMTAWDIAEHYTKEYFDTMDKLNIWRPDIICKATDHIQQMIDLILKMEKNGFTYRTSDGIYFDTSKFKGYAKFARLNLKQLKEGARIEANLEKRNPSDFALWKFSKPDDKRQMEWDSPFGKGFPGWHIECTAMSTHYLGDRYDIHTGGIDHIPVHHTNEIAQAYGATGEENFVNFWLHNNFIVVNGEKMSKSKGNFYTMADIEKRGHDPLAMRYMFMTAHYRSNLNFTWEALESAERTLNTLRNHVAEWKKEEDGKSMKKMIDGYKKDFYGALNDDLNTPIAISIVWKMARDDKLPPSDKLKAVMEFDGILGLKLGENEQENLPEGARKLIDEREKMRDAGKYAETDMLRDRLKNEFGIVIEDTSEGTKWKKK